MNNKTDSLPAEEPVIWWKSDRWSDDIKPVSVYRETAQFIYTKSWTGQKEPSRISKDDHFRTFAEAKAAKVRRLNDEISWRRQDIERLSKRLVIAESLKEPT
jgi:hypothetical protein